MQVSRRQWTTGDDRLLGLESHPRRRMSSTTPLPNGPNKWAQCCSHRMNSSVQLTRFQSNFSPKRTIFRADFGRLATQGQLNHQDLWSGRWESNPMPQVITRNLLILKRA